jgi:hypothetical protein
MPGGCGRAPGSENHIGEISKMDLTIFVNQSAKMGNRQNSSARQNIEGFVGRKINSINISSYNFFSLILQFGTSIALTVCIQYTKTQKEVRKKLLKSE